MGIIEKISTILFPKECPVCGKILVSGEDIFCTECLLNFPWSDPDFQSLGLYFKTLPIEIRPEKLFSLFNYTGGADTKNLLFAIKYHNRPKLAYQLGLILGERIKDHLKGDIIIPVPLHKSRARKRGYNQSEQIAKGVSEITAIPYNTGVLIRKKNTKTLTDKNLSERLTEIGGAFSLNDSSPIEGKNIIIIDDVITTGATIGACLHALKGTKVNSITLLCIARTSL